MNSIDETTGNCCTDYIIIGKLYKRMALNHKLHSYCPNCHVQVELIESCSYSKMRPEHDMGLAYDETDIPLIIEEYVLSHCPKCEAPFLFKREWYEIPAMSVTETSEPELLYPTTARLPVSSLPQTIGKAYRDAVLSYEVGLYKPCVIMCRKCLEALCHEYDITKGSLKAKLALLKERGLVDSKLHSWIDGLRLVGNEAAHDLNVSVQSQDAKDALDFIEAAISYVFLLDKKFDEFRARRDEKA